MSNSLAIRKNRNDILRAIVELQGKNNAKRIPSKEISDKLKLKNTSIIFRLIAMEEDNEIQRAGIGYILDVNAFKHISVK